MGSAVGSEPQGPGLAEVLRESASDPNGVHSEGLGPHEPTRFVVHVGPAPTGAFPVHGFDSVDDLKDELALLDDRPRLTLSFHWQPGLRISLVDAAQCCRTELTARYLGEVHCFASSVRAGEELQRALSPRSRDEVLFDVGNWQVRVVEGDVSTTCADAIVNASNSRLVLGSGVSGAIKREASDPVALQAAMSAHAPLKEGGVAVTGSWLAAAPQLLHVATAIGKPEVIQQSLLAVLRETRNQGWSRVAVPALGCGTGGLSVAQFGELARSSLEQETCDRQIELVFVLRGAADFVAFTDGFRMTGRRLRS